MKNLNENERLNKIISETQEALDAIKQAYEVINKQTTTININWHQLEYFLLYVKEKNDRGSND